MTLHSLYKAFSLLTSLSSNTTTSNSNLSLFNNVYFAESIEEIEHYETEPITYIWLKKYKI